MAAYNRLYIVITHAAALFTGLVLGGIAAGLLSSAAYSDMHSDLAYKHMLINELGKRVAEREARIEKLCALLEIGQETGPCSAQGGCDCPPDIDEGWAGWL